MKKIGILFATIIMAMLFAVSASAETTNFAGGSGTEEDPYLIETKYHLDRVRDDLDAHYKMISDIVFCNSDFAEGGEFYNGGSGWIPIGADLTVPFVGDFDGNGFSISGLIINTNYDIEGSVGLFGCCCGTIENLTVKYSDYFISANGRNYGQVSIGGIVGLLHNGEMFNCLSSMNVIADSSTDYYYPSVGGLIGCSEGSIVSFCENKSNVIVSGISSSYSGGICGYSKMEDVILNCSNSGNIGGGTYSGGIVGSAYYTESITNCINTGNIVGLRNVGGICGLASYEFVIQRCYNSGNILAETEVLDRVLAGGIVGQSHRGVISDCYNLGSIEAIASHPNSTCAGGIAGGTSCDIICCYNVGNVIADSYMAGICANSDVWNGGSVKNCYYINTCEIGIFGLPDKAVSCSKEQMIDVNTFIDFDFNDTWTNQGSLCYPYPELKSVGYISGHMYDTLCDNECYCGKKREVSGHVYASKITKEPTHIEEGVLTYTCECGDTYDEPIEKLEGHTYVSEVTKEATHIEEGTLIFTCECGDTYDESIDKLKEHTYTSKITKEPTHLVFGETTFSCECGDSYTELIAKLEGHTYTSKVIKEPTHIEFGETTFICECGDTYTEVIEKLEGHTYETVITEPTCTSKGYTTYTCVCGDTYDDNYIGKLDHEYTSEITTPATHIIEGVKTFTCECGDSYTESIEKIEKHTYVANVIAPTCSEKGYTLNVCECGDSYKSNYVGMVAHSYKYSIIKATTHTSEGLGRYTCSECGDHYDEPIAKTKEHSYISTTVDSTCTEQGYTLNECECGDSYKTNYLAKTDHNDSNSDGVCDDCGHDLTENCSCNCHKGGIAGFFFKLILFFQKIFKTNQICEGCGIKHY